MVLIDLVGLIMREQAMDLDDAAVLQKAQEKGYGDEVIKEAFDVIDTDEVFKIKSLEALTFVNPITYTIGIHKVGVEKKICFGLLKNTEEIGIRTIDSVRIEERIVDADIIIVHADKSEVRIDTVSKKDARMVQKFFSYVIEAQRARVINVASD